MGQKQEGEQNKNYRCLTILQYNPHANGNMQMQVRNYQN